ncbi:hypothetical protein [Verrucomicrobium sp. BvORR034]|uniref:hypothetical protein n=1 Tax=Verrucomicrobium sp. BvORR034 TaxID=1396418 RepID=UPI000678D677|nr:hypothetical protein [Verrucomicrobium sp. BvORR034]
MFSLHHLLPAGLWRFAAVVTLCLLAPGTSQAQSPPKDPKNLPCVTGIRTWKFVDGTSARFAVKDVRGNVVECFFGQRERIMRPFTAFAPEHQKELEKIRKRQVRVVDFNDARIGFDLVTPVGIPPYPSNPKQRPEEFFTEHPAGLPRQWTRTDGKAVEGSLLSVADDQLAIWIGSRSYAVPVEFLDQESLDYVQRVLKREEMLMPIRFLWGHASMDAPEGMWNFRAHVPPDRALAGYKSPTTFEVAVTSAREFMEEKFGDLKHWELDEVQEFNWWNHPNPSDQPEAWKDATVRPAAGRIFWFSTKDAKIIKLAAQKLPLNCMALRQIGYVLVPVFADGLVSPSDFQR